MTSYSRPARLGGVRTQPRPLATLILTWVVVAAYAYRAPAAILYSYDLDSLVFMSEHIVRGRIAQRNKTGAVQADRLVVTTALMGTLKIGDVVPVVALDHYQKPGELFFGGPAVGEGDEVIAFLTRARSVFGSDLPQGAVVYMPVPSGLKIIVDGLGYGFAQLKNPGGYVMEQARGRTPAPEIGLFERQCAEAIAAFRPIAERLTGATTRADVPWLLQVLRSRAGIDTTLYYHRRDAIAEAVCLKLAEVKDLAALDEALRQTKSWRGLEELWRGFASVQGREYLLQKLSDPDLPAGSGRHESYARALGEGVSAYTGSASTGESVLERLALLAVNLAQRGEEATAAILLSHLQSAASVHVQQKRQSVSLPSNLEPDLIASLKVLKSAYERIRSPRLRFQVDEVMLEAWPEWEFVSAVGPVLTLVTLPGSQERQVTKPGHLSYEYSYRCDPETRGRRFEVEVVLEDVATHRRFVIPVELRIAGGLIGNGTESVALPPDLPRATYRIFHRVLENGQPVGSGHGIELELPLSPR